MNKKTIILSILGLGLSFASLSPIAAFAESAPSDEVITGTITIDDSDNTEVVNAPTASESTVPSNEINEASNCLDENGDLVSNCNTTDLEGALDEGLADEPEVVCADENETGCADPDDPETLNDPEDLEVEDPAMWPLIVSLSALGATVLFVFIINFITHKK